MSKSKPKKIVIKKKIIYKIIIILLSIFILLFIFLYLFLYYLRSLGPFPDVKEYNAIPMPESSIIYDRNGIELYKIYSEKRTYVNYEDINKNMINAIVAGEDKRFWNHPGYDSIGIIRAIFNGIITRTQFSGTSGITQQLAKVTYLTDERTIERKIKELYLSIELDSIFEKKDILELYLNKIFFGGNSYGVEQASQTFFGIRAKELGILESSILASLPKAPTGLSPYHKKEKLLGFPIVTNVDNLRVETKILSKNDLEIKNKEIDLLIKFVTINRVKKHKNNPIFWDYFLA